MRADLHSHTKYSDGVYTVREVIELAKKNNVDVLAITDHDCFDGALEAYNLQDEYGIKIIFGMELSTYSNDESIHILAYYNKPLKSGELFDMLNNQRVNRKYLKKNENRNTTTQNYEMQQKQFQKGSL